jgi:hypothetical protein
MGVAKVTLNGTTLIDTTGKTVTSSSMLSGITALDKKGDNVTGNISSKSSTDLTVSGATVTAPAGYYANAASKAVATTTHPNPTASIASSAGVVTASHTQGTGYVTGGTTTGTLNLTTKAAATYNTSTSDQTIASNRWLTGTQTIKSVTTSNLTAANIKSGVVVKVGDANNASRITQVTGTLKEESFTATISGTGNSSYCYVQLNGGTKYYTSGDTFTFKAGDSLYCYTYNSGGVSQLIGVNGSIVKSGTTSANYTYTMPNRDIGIVLQYSGVGGISINESVVPTAYRTAYTYTPTTYNITIPSGVHIAGSQTIQGDSNLIASNIKSGISIFGVSGTYESPYYSAYKAMAYKQANQGVYAPYVSEWIGDLSMVGDSQFAYTMFSGSCYFNNCQTIGRDGFIFGDGRDVTGTGVRTDMYFPVCTDVGYDAFRGNLNLYSISAPNCTSIRASAFLGTNLEIASFPKCSSIEYSTFYNCARLTTASFPVCTTIGANAFSRCGVLTTISFPVCTTIKTGAFLTCTKLTVASFPACTQIDSNAFMSCWSMSTALFPVCTIISNSAFNRCSVLTTISFPECVTIGHHAFISCFSLQTISFPKCTTIGSYGFYGCWSLTEARFPECTDLGSNAFAACTLLQTVSFPVVSIIGDLAFNGCYSLLTISFPECESIGVSAFTSCSRLSSVSLPKLKIIGSSAFYGCSSLTTLSFPNCTEISYYAFKNCYNLISFYLTDVSSVPPLGINVFYSTPIGGYSASAGRYGSIFVPASLYSAFISATNWVSYSSRIVSV